jgi:hypothetical protein
MIQYSSAMMLNRLRLISTPRSTGARLRGPDRKALAAEQPTSGAYGLLK